jgi:hypothetical protein
MTARPAPTAGAHPRPFRGGDMLRLPRTGSRRPYRGRRVHIPARAARDLSLCSCSKKPESSAGGAGAASAPPAWANTPAPTIGLARTARTICRQRAARGEAASSDHRGSHLRSQWRGHDLHHVRGRRWRCRTRVCTPSGLPNTLFHHFQVRSHLSARGHALDGTCSRTRRKLHRSGGTGIMQSRLIGSAGRLLAWTPHHPVLGNVHVRARLARHGGAHHGVGRINRLRQEPFEKSPARVSVEIGGGGAVYQFTMTAPAR